MQSAERMGADGEVVSSTLTQSEGPAPAKLARSWEGCKLRRHYLSHLGCEVCLNKEAGKV